MSFDGTAAAVDSEPVRLRRRPDLVVRRESLGGATFYMVKDPLRLQYFRFEEAEYRVLELLDGRRTEDEICRAFAASMAPRTLDADELREFIERLEHGGLVISETGGRGRALLRTADARRKRRRLAALTSILYIKLPGFDPEPLLNRLYPWVRWVFSPGAVAAAVLLIIAALLLVTVQFDVFLSRPEMQRFDAFFNVGNIVWLWLALGIIKILHEFGHGLTCKHFGGECHDMGVLFLIFTPCLFCNVSDAWMMRGKWRRIAVSAAGVYVELLVAAVATFVWWFTAPGMLHSLAFAAMFIGSANTLLINANPLMRYDGYYVVSDLLEIPNLRQKSFQLLQHLFSKWCIGLAGPPPGFLPERGRGWFVLYAVCAYLYRWLLTIVILWFLYTFLKPYKLGVISVMLAAGVICLSIVIPAVRNVRTFWQRRRTGTWRKRRFVLTAISASLLVALVALVPLPLRVSSVLTIEPVGAEPVFVTVPARLVQVHVGNGRLVRAGEPIAELSSASLRLEIEQLRHQGRMMEVARQTASAMDRLPDALTAERALADAAGQLEQRERQAAELLVRAPRDGVVLPPPIRPEQEPERRGVSPLPIWSRTPLEPENLGASFEAGTVLCLVARPHALEAVLVIAQDEVESVREGQRVRLKLESLPERTLLGTITEIALHEAESAPEQLGKPQGGELMTGADGERLLTPYYRARVSLDDADAESMGILCGLRGMARIECGERTLGVRLWRFLNRTFRL